MAWNMLSAYDGIVNEKEMEEMRASGTTSMHVTQFD